MGRIVVTVDIATLTFAIVATIAAAITLIRQETLMATAKESIAAIGAQLEKASAEIVGLVGDLESKVAEGTVSQDDLAPLVAAAQRLDDIVPDAPEVDPEPEVAEPE